MMKKPYIESRRKGRAPIETDIKVIRARGGTVLEDVCKTVNVSRQGAYFLTKEAYAAGERVSVVLHYKEGDVSIPVPAHVVRVERARDSVHNAVAVRLEAERRQANSPRSARAEELIATRVPEPLMRYLDVCILTVILSVWLMPLSATPSLPDAHSLLLRAQAMNFTVEGKITRHDPGKLTISSGENILFHVRYDDKTGIKNSDGSPGTAKDLRVGVVVRVEGELTESGEIIAARIEIQKP